MLACVCARIWSTWVRAPVLAILPLVMVVVVRPALPSAFLEFQKSETTDGLKTEISSREPSDVVFFVRVLLQAVFSFGLFYFVWFFVRLLRRPLVLQAGGDRQDLHEKIRVHSMAAGMAVKGEGKANDLMDRVAADPAFEAVHGKLESLIDPVLFIGRSPEQVQHSGCVLLVMVVVVRVIVDMVVVAEILSCFFISHVIIAAA